MKHRAVKPYLVLWTAVLLILTACQPTTIPSDALPEPAETEALSPTAEPAAASSSTPDQSPTATAIERVEPSDTATVEEAEPDDQIELKTGITYSTVEDQALRMDVAIPPGESGPYPAVLFIFGGGWRMGGRSQFSRHIQLAAERGYVGATIDHRLVKVQDGQPVNTFPAQVYDVKCAVRWLRSHADEYQIDPARIGVIGWSSGGHLALMLAFTDPSDQLEGSCGDMNTSSSVQAAVSLAGPFDFRSEEEVNFAAILQKFLGGTREEVPENYTLASPLYYADVNDPQVLIVAGENDTSVGPELLAGLDERLTDIGVTHRFVVVEEADHNELGMLFTDLFDIVFEFFDETLN